MNFEDRSVNNSGTIHGNVSTGNVTAAPASAPRAPKKKRLISTPQVIGALIMAAAAIAAAVIGYLKA